MSDDELNTFLCDHWVYLTDEERTILQLCGLKGEKNGRTTIQS